MGMHLDYLESEEERLELFLDVLEMKIGKRKEKQPGDFIFKLDSAGSILWLCKQLERSEGLRDAEARECVKRSYFTRKGQPEDERPLQFKSQFLHKFAEFCNSI